MNKDDLSLAQIRNSFDFTAGDDIVDSYDSLWHITEGDYFELYIHAPNRHIDSNQIKEFNLFVKNRTSILSEMDLRMKELLKQKEISKKIIAQPLQMSILSVVHQGKDFESKPCDYTIELICSKNYKSFFAKRSFDIVAHIKQGQLLIIFDEIN